MAVTGPTGRGAVVDVVVTGAAVDVVVAVVLGLAVVVDRGGSAEWSSEAQPSAPSTKNTPTASRARRTDVSLRGVKTTR